MAQSTKIEWTDATWNPVHGCSKVSPGCAHCYAEALSLRYGHTSKPWTPENAAENVILKPHKLREPLKWREPRMVFVNSMSDLFHELVPSTYIIDVFNVMREAQQHTFQILTKRPERMANMLRSWPLREHWPNVWLGTSIENRRFVGRADWLRLIDPAVRFISAEPLLGPLAERNSCGSCWDWPDDDCPECGGLLWWWSMESLDLGGIHWMILGGESGPKHRRCDPDWMRDLVELARNPAMDCAVFVKQMGGARPGDRLEDLPEDLRVREFPQRVPA